MGNPNRVVGRCKVKVDGGIYETDGSTSLDLGGITRDAVEGDYQAGAFKETDKPSKADVTILVKAGTRLTDIQKIDNATLTVETDIGQTFVVRNAYCAETVSFNGSDGKAKVVFMGPPAEEMTA